MDQPMNTFEEFWPYYLRQHASPSTRALHYCGVLIALVLLVGMVLLLEPLFLVAALVAAYAFAWIGHYVFEGNRPATFTHPLWSFMGDIRMFRLWIMGRLDRELVKAGIQG
jgi:hypothetical protein